METHRATIDRKDEKTSLVLHINNEQLEIELTEDKPNAVKSVFNNLIASLKKGVFKFELEDEKEDLYFHICTEYMGQLNTELSSIHQELEDYELIDKNE
ncbi:hypothetical protein [Tenacibaculum sp. IB213877]|uniref:hypothetical protein n=1 Tax=Tenacibaculum sp. IB213877 TaxID=3097351 RepID=UPI002A5ADE78|nr:hypothetical protein [Tenacibaculum sp. IB213877]MDY0779386.1 hypothetical protein [Tenacibaculum sp. IB213877]